VAAAESEADSLDDADIPAQGAEYATELFYGVSVIQALVLRPNLQFIHDPAGTPANDDALILGHESGRDLLDRSLARCIP